MTPPKDPREWVVPLKTLIINDGKGSSAWVRQDREDETHVIEYSAYEEALADCREAGGDIATLEMERDALKAELEERRIATPTMNAVHILQAELAAEKQKVARLREKCEGLDVELWQAKGALGYPVPGHIPESPTLKCGLCEAKYLELIKLRARNGKLREALTTIFSAPTIAHDKTALLVAIDVIKQHAKEALKEVGK